jgi:hypothetical protein
MNQSQHPVLTQPATRLQCLCGESLLLPDDGGAWILAAHRGAHSPGHVLAVPDELIESLPPALDAAGGWAAVFAADLAFDLAVARNIVMAALVGGATQASFSVSLGRMVSCTLQRAALAFSVTAAPEELVGELNLAAVLLNEAAEDARISGQRGGVGRCSGLRLAASPERLTDALRATLRTVEQPLLVLVPPPSPADEVIDARTVGALAAELSELPVSLGAVERALSGQLLLAFLTAQPLPVIAEQALDRIAHDIAEIHLARLRATCLAEALVGSDDVDTVCWAASTAERVIERTIALTGHLEEVLACYD